MRCPCDRSKFDRWLRDQMAHLIIRGFKDRQLVFHQSLTIPVERISDLIPSIAAEHIEAMNRGEISMVEVEFLDEPDPHYRFLRARIDPDGVIRPVESKRCN